jgi:hypothetical protein
MFVAGNALLKGMMADAIDAAGSGILPGILTGSKLCLFTNQAALTAATLVTDLTEPTYPGYVRQSVGAFQGPLKEQDGSWSVISGECIFQMADATVPTTVVGAFLVDSKTGTVFIGGAVFDTPQNLLTADDAVALLAQINLPADAVGGDMLLI